MAKRKTVPPEERKSIFEMWDYKAEALEMLKIAKIQESEKNQKPKTTEIMRKVYKIEITETKAFEKLEIIQQKFAIRYTNIESIENALNVLINTGYLNGGLNRQNQEIVKELFENAKN